MDAKEYLQQLMAEDEAELAQQPVDEPAEPQADDIDERIKAAVAEVAEPLNQRIAAQDQELAKFREDNAPPDPETHWNVNGTWQPKPTTEEAWLSLLGEARGRLEENPELQPNFDALQGHFYRWQGRQGALAVQPKPEEAPEAPEGDEGSAADATKPEPTTLDDKHVEWLNAHRLGQDTRGFKAVESMVGNGFTFEQALDAIGVDINEPATPTDRSERGKLISRAQEIPEGDSSMAPPRKVLERHKNLGSGNKSRDMNAALAAFAAKKKSVDKLFK